MRAFVRRSIGGCETATITAEEGPEAEGPQEQRDEDRCEDERCDGSTSGEERDAMGMQKS